MSPLFNPSPSLELVVIAGTGTEVFNGASPITWTDLDLSAVVGANRALVLLKLYNVNAGPAAIRKKGDTDDFYHATQGEGMASLMKGLPHKVLMACTDSAGVIQWITGTAQTWIIDVMAYSK